MTSFNVAPGEPKVIDPPPVTPAPVTEYSVASAGDAANDNNVVPL